MTLGTLLGLLLSLVVALGRYWALQRTKGPLDAVQANAIRKMTAEVKDKFDAEVAALDDAALDRRLRELRDQPLP